MTDSVAFFIGSATAANVQTLLKNISKMLDDEFELHLITTTPSEIDADVLDLYQVYGKEYPATILGGTRALWTYSQNHTPKAIVQLTKPPIHALITGLIAQVSEIPSVYRYSGDRFYVFKIVSGLEKVKMYLLNNVIGRIAMNLSDNHIVLGPTGEQRLVQRRITQKQITILPPSIDTARIDTTNKALDFDIPDSRSVALFLGRLHPRKGLTTLEKTIPEILDNREDIQFVFVGGEYNFDIPIQYQDHITMVGEVPPDEVPSYLDFADVLIHPSLTEGLPRAILESLAAGTPVVARNVGEISSITNNTFDTDIEFIDMVCQFEKLPTDDVTPYTVTELSKRYRHYFRKLE